MKTCEQCHRPLRESRRSAICAECASVCACGARKHYKALTCGSCRSKARWAAKRAVASIRRAYEQLEVANFHQQSNGRWYAHYFRLDGRRRSVARARWVWEQANGLIPHRYHIHHLNHDRGDDRLENLGCLSPSEHQSHHAQDTADIALVARGLVRRRQLLWRCCTCGTEFMRKEIAALPRSNSFCSSACQLASLPRHQAKAAVA